MAANDQLMVYYYEYESTFPHDWRIETWCTNGTPISPTACKIWSGGDVLKYCFRLVYI